MVTSIRGEEVMENLLFVEKRGPFKVQGRIVVESGNRTHVAAVRATRLPRTIDVEITGVRMSIGWTDGGPHIWVASDYGFFELVHPSPEYAPVYNSMMQAITLYYTVQGIYEAASATGGKEMSLDEVLFQYALDTGEALVKEEVEELCERHAQFLASHFIKETQFEWAGKQFAKYIKGLAKNPKRAEVMLYPTGPSLRLHRPRLPRFSLKLPGLALCARLNGLGRLSGLAPTQRESAERAEPTRPPSMPATAAATEERSRETAAKLYDAMVGVANIDNLEPATLAGLGWKVYMKYKFRMPKGPTDAMKYYAHELVRLMNADKELGPRWAPSPLYLQLAAIAEPLRARDLHHIMPDKIDSSLIKRKRKTRPRTPQPAGYVSTSDASTDKVRRPRQGRTSGLRLSNPRKRPLSEAERAVLSGKGPTAPKRSRMDIDSFGYDNDEVDDGFEAGGNPASMEEEGEDSSDSSEDITLSDGGEDQAPVRIVLEVEDIPSTRPLGPNGTWVCEHGDCGHIVRAADGSEGRQAVRQHLREHEEDRSSKVQLALAEGRATGNQRIEHLLNKLKQLGDPEVEKAEARKPQPIQKKHGLLF
ncbi:unnamed protein product [Parascedosporium putredinis]|uniref:Uncharacterized protein n=1 Tax=Parascedosporium putredinis TaxID=1442378 RepID=A0A9P1GUC5_9PEZI|nr:unnamed protein product [Parascedosporium putredinis]CAI7987486.1 unnamed protein product [Parascedosporium putredinis]